MGGLKFCKDCKWYASYVAVNDQCRHPDFERLVVDLVDGLTRDKNPRACRDVRADETLCGEAGKMFEADKVHRCENCGDDSNRHPDHGRLMDSRLT